MSIKVFIVDDEALARDELSFLLKSLSEVDIIGEAEDGDEALNKISELKPDVIFLDIQMPEMDGLTVAKKLYESNSTAIIVFATAYDQHAIEAFEVNAIDYLLKPFDEDRVKKTVHRIKDKLNKHDEDNISKWIQQYIGESQKSNKKISKLSAQSEEGVILIDPEDVVYAYRENRDVLIKTKEKSLPTKYSLQTLEEKLKNYPFFRTHRSYLVNLHYIEEMVPWFNGAYNLIVKDDHRSKVPVSRQYVKELKEVLEL